MAGVHVLGQNAVQGLANGLLHVPTRVHLIHHDGFHLKTQLVLMKERIRGM